MGWWRLDRPLSHFNGAEDAGQQRETRCVTRIELEKGRGPWIFLVDIIGHCPQDFVPCYGEIVQTTCLTLFYFAVHHLPDLSSASQRWYVIRAREAYSKTGQTQHFQNCWKPALRVRGLQDLLVLQMQLQLAHQPGAEHVRVYTRDEHP